MVISYLALRFRPYSRSGPVGSAGGVHRAATAPAQLGAATNAQLRLGKQIGGLRQGPGPRMVGHWCPRRDVQRPGLATISGLLPPRGEGSRNVQLYAVAGLVASPIWIIAQRARAVRLGHDGDMPRAFASVATGTAALITLLAVAGLALAATSAPTYTGAFTILAGFAILTVAAGIATIKTGERIWGYLLATGMIATTTLAFYAAAS